MARSKDNPLLGLFIILAILAIPFIWLYHTFGWGGPAGLAVLLLCLLIWWPAQSDKAGRRMQSPAARDWQLFLESAQIVAGTKNKKTARSRYELMLRLWQEGKIEGNSVSALLQQARIKAELLEAGKRSAPADDAFIISSGNSDGDDGYFLHQLRQAESALSAGRWEEARFVLRKMGYAAAEAAPALQQQHQSLGKRIVLEDPLYQAVLAPLLPMIAASPGEKQTAYYARFPESSAEELREILYWAAQAGVLRRVKKGNTYLLYLPEEEGVPTARLQDAGA